MGKPVFVLSHKNQILLIFVGWGSLVDVLNALSVYITAKIVTERDSGDVYAELTSLREDVLERYKIGKYDSYRLLKVCLPTEDQIFVSEILRKHEAQSCADGNTSNFLLTNNEIIIRKPS